MTKAITDFGGYTGAAFCTLAQTIHDSIAPIAAQFPDLPTSLADLQTLIDTCQTALQKKASRAVADTLAFNVARSALEEALGGIANYVNIVAKGDPTKVIPTSIPFYETGNSPDYSPPPAPTDLVLRQGDVSGEAVLRMRPKRTPSMNEVQTCTGDPNSEVNWKTVGMFSGGKATLPGLTPGATIWVRARTAGLKGVLGDWSEPTKMMVT